MRKFLCILLGGAILLSNNCINTAFAAENDTLIENVTSESSNLESDDIDFEMINYDLSDYNISIDNKMSDDEVTIPELEARDWTEYMSVYCLTKLGKAEKALWIDLHNMAMKYATTTRNSKINVGETIYFLEPVSCHGLEPDRAKEIVDMFLYQCPQFYFLDKYRRCTKVNETEYEISLSIYKAFIDGEARKEASKQFLQKVDSLIQEINTEIDKEEYIYDFKKAKIVHDKVCEKNVYDSKEDGTQNEFLESAWSSVMLGQAVCAGYSKLYTMLANAVGLDTIGITSWSIRSEINNLPVGVKPVPHAWNKSYIDGNWYVVDTTWDDDPEGVGTISYDCFLVSDKHETFKKDTAHDFDSFYLNVAPLSIKAYDLSVDLGGIFIADSSKNGIVCGAVTSFLDKKNLEYRWIVNEVGSKEETIVSDWTLANEWLSWEPVKSGNYNLKCEVRYNGVNSTTKECEQSLDYKKYIKGICQMPYEGEGGGYLIGIESFENPNQSYKYQLLILDCTLLAQGMDAWIYGTVPTGVSEGNALWIVWQPQYGYYWTLFRVFDENDQLIDELCYGFVNAY